MYIGKRQMAKSEFMFVSVSELVKQQFQNIMKTLWSLSGFLSVFHQQILKTVFN